MKSRFGLSLVMLTGMILMTGCYGGHGDGHYGGHKGLSHGSMYEIQSVQAGETPVAFVLNKMTGEVQAVFCGAAKSELKCLKSNMVNFESAVIGAAHPESMKDHD